LVGRKGFGEERPGAGLERSPAPRLGDAPGIDGNGSDVMALGQGPNPREPQAGLTVGIEQGDIDWLRRIPRHVHFDHSHLPEYGDSMPWTPATTTS
jgi:hypothetical protein